MSSVGQGTRKKKKLKSQAQTMKKSVENKNSIILYPPYKEIKPGNNFYMYINGTWIKKTQIPPQYASYGVSEEVYKDIKKKLKDIMYSSIQYSKTKPSPNESHIQQYERLLGNLAQSAFKKSPENITLLKAMLAKIQSIQTKDEVARMMGDFARYEILGFINLYGTYMTQRNLQYSLIINTGFIVGLPKSFYLKKSMGRDKFFHDLIHFVNKLGSLLDIPNLHEAVYIEKKMAKKLESTEDDKEIEKKGSELENEFKDIPWEEIFKTYGFAPWKKESFFVKSISWLHYVNNCFRTWPIEQWKTILSLECIFNSLDSLPDPFDTLSFDFFNKSSGRLKKPSLEDDVLSFLTGVGGMFLSRLYVEKYLPMSIKKNVEKMVNELRDTTKERIDKLDWLEKTTRKKAIEKVEKMRSAIAFPDNFYEGPVPLLNKDYLYLNVLQLKEWYTIHGFQKLGEKLEDRKDWPEGVYNVNAYYTNDSNKITVPSGIIHFPFYSDKPPSFGFNLGGLGCVIAHEIIHAFDDDGKDIDPDGLKKKWWTSKNLRQYTKKTKGIVELFSKEKISHHHISGDETLSENIADIGGMAIALATVKKRIEKECLHEKAQKQIYRDFFTSYATSWRQMDRKKKILFNLLEDVHSPSSMRVNLVVNQFQEWYEAFDVTEKDSMYIPPEKRISIF